MNTVYGIASMAVRSTVVYIWYITTLIWHLDELLSQRSSDFSLPKRNLPQKIQDFLVASELLWLFYSKLLSCFFVSRIWTCSLQIFCQRNLHVSTQGLKHQHSPPSLAWYPPIWLGKSTPRWEIKSSPISFPPAGRGALCGAPEPGIYTGWMMGDVNISFHQSELNPGFGVFRRSLVC